MTEDEQRIIFSRNLKHLISISGKQQLEVAKDLDVKTSTLSTWCSGKAMPGVGKIRAIADYFGVGLTDLVNVSTDDTNLELSSIMSKLALYDKRFCKLIIEYYNLPHYKKNLLLDFFEGFF